MKTFYLIFSLFLTYSCTYFKKENEKIKFSESIETKIDTNIYEKTKLDSLELYLNYFYVLDKFEIENEIERLNKNDSIYYATQVLRILNEINFDKLSDEEIQRSHDNRLLIFSKEIQTGGSASCFSHIIAYKNQNGKFNILTPPISEENEQSNLGGAWIDRIYKLPSKSKNFYLILGGGIGNNSTNYSLASVIELNKNSISFNRNIFDYIDSTNLENYLTSKSSFTIDYYNGFLEDIIFKYDTIKNQLIYKYPLELNSDTGNSGIIWVSKKIKFDGYRFKGYVY